MLVRKSPGGLSSIQRNVKNWRNCLPQGREHQLLMKYQIIIPENIHAINISQGEQGVLMLLKLYVFTCKHVTTVNERRGHVFERESRVVYGGGVEKRNSKEEIL